MAKSKAVAHFVAVSDTSKPLAEQEGILVTIDGRGGDTEKNRAKALEVVTQMWEAGEIEDEKFPNGISEENIVYVPPQSPQLQTLEDLKQEELPPIVQGAQEIIELTRLQVEVQEAAEDVAPYTPIIEAVLERTRPLTAEEKEMAKERKYGKAIERVGYAIAQQEECRERSTGNGKLILNAIAWQLQQTFPDAKK
ncbi:hypothetical protein K4A83_11405 [Spirulina subsalsa FACHB-351]|uniref:Uncharacterized protein n=1 Tax=Spirulina subsalsa FACHB-351 TaxID=234711 RepID=A0ABT3L6Z6_9CYAN|nr:hypothetical protein [Spirulina subsalsa]MCW6036864.1 hypothetical protein [Spirulina subsalsa FACHB-351]